MLSNLTSIMLVVRCRYYAAFIRWRIRLAFLFTRAMMRDMIGEIALAIEMGADAVDIGKTIHPHPTLGESIGMAAEVAHGSCTDVPPARK